MKTMNNRLQAKDNNRRQWKSPDRQEIGGGKISRKKKRKDKKKTAIWEKTHTRQIFLFFYCSVQTSASKTTLPL